MLNRVVGVQALSGYRLTVEFQDGVSGIVDLSRELEGEVFEPLRDEALFCQVSVDEFGAVAWPNGADLAPDALYAEIAGGVSRERPSENAGGKLMSEPEAGE
jgi:hypothetical protein